jgi:hypothetical protein
MLGIQVIEDKPIAINDVFFGPGKTNPIRNQTAEAANAPAAVAYRARR